MPIRIVVDAMGGDFAPAEPVKAAVEALQANEGIEIILTGNEAQIRAELEKQTYPADRLRIVPTTEVIETGEPPAAAVTGKRDSSLVVGLQMLRKGEAEGFVSSGSTGAVLVGGQVIVRKLPGIRRAPLAPLIPTEKGVSLLIDCGANVDAKAEQLVQFAVMGSIYMKEICGIASPTVGLVNIGTEEEKGNALVKEAYQLLKACPDIHFAGNVEARDIPKGAADVYVTEAFTGNIVLKLYEGVADSLVHVIKKGLMQSLRSKIGGALVKPALKKTLAAYDTANHGGAPLLGLDGLVVKTHGSAHAVEIRNGILQCVQFYKQDVNGRIRAYLEKAASDKDQSAGS